MFEIVLQKTYKGWQHGSTVVAENCDCVACVASTRCEHTEHITGVRNPFFVGLKNGHPPVVAKVVMECA